MKTKKYYKLTDQDMKTYNGFQWKLGKTVKTRGKGPLCTNGWIHCYTHPYLAVLLNPIHAYFENPRLFEIEVDGKYVNDMGLKIGWSEVTLIKEIPIPNITLDQRVKFGILCAMQVYKTKEWVIWANTWLKNKPCTNALAHSAANAARAADAAYAAAYAAPRSAARAARAAYAAYAAAYAAYAAYAAVYAAAYAAAEAAEAAVFDVIKIAIKSVEE